MKIVKPPKLIYDPANTVPDAGEVECIARQLTANGYRVFSGEIRALWRAYQAALEERGALAYSSNEGGWTPLGEIIVNLEAEIAELKQKLPQKDAK